MKRFQLTRKEKLLYATPLLLPLLVWSMVATNTFERRLHELAGPSAIDCGTVSDPAEDQFGLPREDNPCAVAAFEAGKPFLVRENNGSYPAGSAMTPQGKLYEVSLYRHRWHEKAELIQAERWNPRVSTPEGQTPKIDYDVYLPAPESFDPNPEWKMPETETTHVWW